jgi:hypothetical protein
MTLTSGGALEDRFQSEAVNSPSGVTHVTLSRHSRRQHGGTR